MISPGSVSALTELYATESARIREQFEATGDGRGAGLARAALVDALVARLYGELLSHDLNAPKGFCLVALGGYGRRELFPQSDIDLLFLSESNQMEASQRDAVAALARALWDLRLRVGQTTRRLAECAQLQRENLEFNLSLLDCRYLAGDPWLFARLRHDAVPHVVARDRQDLVRGLAEITRHRHEKHGYTVFHLEPNLKEAPGGLRDYNVARWLTLISELEQQGRWVNAEDLWPAPLGAASARALEFLSAARCFLHYRQGRDDNLLSYESQDQAATLGIGHRLGQAMPAAEWMRSYFRHARAIHQLTARLLNDITPARSSLYALFQDWRSRLSNADFAVVRGRIFPRQPAVVDDPNLLLDLFEMVARQGIELSREAERWVEECLRGAGTKAANLPGLWQHFGHILVLPHAAEALRTMHCLGLVVTLFPEFHAIDCLVIRDFYHRYTVDEHTFMTIESLQALGPAGRGPTAGQPRESLQVWEQRFSEIFAELERPELLLFSLLFHDVGKGRPASDHVAASLEAVEAIVERLALDPEGRETIQFLISNHLEMSATLLRRDIFDPETIRLLAEKVGTSERLKMLTLLTYADVKGVNPEALTPWKAEVLWQLHAATSNYLARNLDRERVHGAQETTAKVERARRLVSTSGGVEEFNAFLEGFPKRYLLTHAAEEIAAHYAMACQLPRSRAEVALRTREHYFELTVLTADRPFLFASLTRTLAAWGMNIVKADAFGNAAGTVLDTFRFVDLFRTLELNPSERERFKQSVVDVLTGKVSLQALMRGRLNPRGLPRPKVAVPTQVRFDDVSSSQSTLLELITQDRPGLLYRVSSALAELGCNIEVALIDTEGQKVIDVFYLTWQGKKLTLQKQTQLREALLRALEALHTASAALPAPE
jgi:[protein-PII] uridylyltransferase